MKLRELVIESWLGAVAARISTALTALVVAAMCVTAILTVGHAAASRAEVLARLDSTRARTLSVIDGKNEGFINDATAAGVASINKVQSVTVLGAARDVVNGALGVGSAAIPMWTAPSVDQSFGRLIAGRWPMPGEALVGTQARDTLGFETPYGFVTSPSGVTRVDVVGLIQFNDEHRDLDVGVLRLAVGESQRADARREIRVVISDIDAAADISRATLDILNPVDQASVTVNSPVALAQTVQSIEAQMRTAGRSLMLVILAAGGFFVATVVFSDVLVHRRDLGRRRTLGITRSDLIGMVILRTLVGAGIGAVVGMVAGYGSTAIMGFAPPMDFTISVGVLAVLTATVAAVVPAGFAASRDPVSVMRIP